MIHIISFSFAVADAFLNNIHWSSSFTEDFFSVFANNFKSGHGLDSIFSWDLSVFVNVNFDEINIIFCT